MKDNVWDRIWEKDSYSDEKLRIIKTKLKINEIVRFVNFYKDYKVLDVGCGAGYITNEIYNKFECDIIGIDASEIAIEKAKSLNRNIAFKVMNANDIHYPQSNFDIVLCIGLIEHVQDIDKCIGEIKKTTKNKGKIVIITSNKFSFMFIHRKLKEFLRTWKYGYQRNWTSNKLKLFLEENSFDVLNIDYITIKGDFVFLNFLDSIFSLFIKQWSRYIILIGEVSKHD